MGKFLANQVTAATKRPIIVWNLTRNSPLHLVHTSNPDQSDERGNCAKNRIYVMNYCRGLVE